MEQFVYKAVTKTGKVKKGNIEAEDSVRALERIRAIGLIPLEVKESNLFNKELEIEFGNRVKARDISIFCRQFVSMMQAGVAIMDSLGMLAQQTENRTMAKAIREVQKDIGKGESLSNAMGKQEHIFPEIMISMVTAGEASGKLETAFERMADHFEKEERLRGMIKKASMYPIIVAIVALVVIIVMLVKVVPSYSKLFEDLGTEMPAITLFVVHASEFIMDYWYLIVAVIVAAIVGIRVFSHSDAGEHFFGKLKRKMPIFGKLNIKTEASMFARTLSTLLYSGLPMVEALEIVAGTMTNALYRDALREAKEEVIKGVPLSEPIEKSGLFPPMVTHMTKIGEETGEIEEMLTRLSSYYDEEVEMATQTVMAALEPLIIIFMAVVVVFLIVAVMSPMMAMYSGLDNL